MSSVRAVSRLTDEQVDDLEALFAAEWWTCDRQRDDIVQMLQHSDVVMGLIDVSDRLVAFARVLTDRVYKAILFDVMVRSDRRGEHLGDTLLNELFARSELKSVRHWELYCLPEMESYYERLGFSADVSGVRLLRRSASTDRPVSKEE